MRMWARLAIPAVAAALGAGLPAGSAQADETHRGNSHVGSSYALIDTGQIDDPAEDVLEHTLLLGGEYSWR